MTDVSRLKVFFLQFKCFYRQARVLREVITNVMLDNTSFVYYIFNLFPGSARPSNAMT